MADIYSQLYISDRVLWIKDCP